MENYRLIGVNAAGRRVGQDNQFTPPLTDADVELIRELYEKGGWKKTGRPPKSFDGWTQSKLAQKFEVPKSTISGIISHRRRFDYPVRFKKVRAKD